MKVFIVTYEGTGWYTYPSVEAVFSTEEKAWDYIDKKGQAYLGTYDVDEREVDNEDLS